MTQRPTPAALLAAFDALANFLRGQVAYLPPTVSAALEVFEEEAGTGMFEPAAPDLGAVSTADLIAELYRRPLAVCVFEPVDLLAEEGGAFDGPDDAAQWLADKADSIADAMSGAGWDSVRDLLTADGRATGDDED